MTRINATAILDRIKAHGVTHVVGLPDNGSRALFELLFADEDVDLISVTREGEALAVASGLFIGGKRPFVIMQNTGFFESGDAIRGTAHNMGLPLVMLIGYRGYETINSGAKIVDTAATFFEPTLKAWQIPYWWLKSDDDVSVISTAFEKATESEMPTAVIYPGETI